MRNNLCKLFGVLLVLCCCGCGADSKVNGGETVSLVEELEYGYLVTEKELTMDEGGNIRPICSIYRICSLPSGQAK